MSNTKFISMWIGGMTVFVVNLLLFYWFHDRSWIPSDDGVYAHIADRVAHGELLHADVEELHPGYADLLNVLALNWFGRDLISLRYPLVAVSLIQSLCVFWCFARIGIIEAIVASLSITAVGAFQIASPTPSHYCLFLTVVIVTFLVRDIHRKDYILGFLVGLVFLFRQLSGVFVAIGVLTVLLAENRTCGDALEKELDAVNGGNRRIFGARCLLLLMFGGVAAYLFRATDLAGLFLIGVWPLGLLLLSWRQIRVGNLELLAMLGKLAAGALVAVVPLIAYHQAQGSLGAWAHDCFVRSISVQRMVLEIDVFKYIYLIFAGFRNLFWGVDVHARLNGLYWVLLPLLTTMLGVGAWRARARLDQPSSPNLALPIVAVFYSLVSILMQIPYYLYLSAGLTLIGILWVCSPYQIARHAAYMGAAGLSMIGLYYQAGQPHTRSFNGVMRGIRVAMIRSPLEYCSIWMDPREAAKYQELVNLIVTETDPHAAIFVFPNNSELYFLADRPNPFRFFDSTLGLRNEEEVDAFLTTFTQVGPLLVIHNKESGSNTPLTRRLLHSVNRGYDLIHSIGQFDVYRVIRE